VTSTWDILLSLGYNRFTVVALEMLVRGEGLPGFPDPFSELHPRRLQAAQIKLESLPMTC